MKIDFSRIEPHQLVIHERLRNWARWCSVRPQSRVQPMFRYYRPAQHWDEKAFRESCDLIDAQALEKVISTLPTKHAYSVRWWYVYNVPVGAACKRIGLNSEGLYKHVRDGRQFLINLTNKADIAATELRHTIELCWQDYEKKSLTPGEKIFIAKTCEMLEEKAKAAKAGRLEIPA